MVVNGHDALGMCIMDVKLPFALMSHGTCDDVIRHVRDKDVVILDYVNPQDDRSELVLSSLLAHGLRNPLSYEGAQPPTFGLLVRILCIYTIRHVDV